MSIALMNVVWDADLDAKSKLILLSLADNANDTGICWPTQATIARRASLSERSVRDYLHRLADEGLITVLELGNGRGLSTKYRLNPDAIKAAKAAETEQKAAETDVKAEDTCRPTVISQPPSSTVDLSARARASIRWYEETTGRSVRNTTLRQVLADIGDTHPPECVTFAWAVSAGASEPWPYVQRVFQGCALGTHAHERQRGSNGTSGQRIRTGAGRGGGRTPNLIDKWDAYLAEHPDAGLPAPIEGVGGAAGDVGGDV